MIALSALPAFAILRRPLERPSNVEVPKPVVTTTPIVTVTATATPQPTVVQTIPTAAPTPTPVKMPTSPPKPALTPEQWAQKVVAGPRSQKALRECVEFDLWKVGSNVPKAYAVTTRIGTDLLPDTSVYSLSPRATNGLASCVKLALFRAFNDAGSSPSTKDPFTFTASFAFPNAQPNPGSLPDREWGSRPY